MKLKNIFLSTLAITALAGTTYSVTNVDQYLTSEDSIYDEIDTVQGYNVYTNKNLTLTLEQDTPASSGNADIEYVDVYGIELNLYLSSFVSGTQSSNAYTINATLDFTNAKYDFDTNDGGSIDEKDPNEKGIDYSYYTGNTDSIKLQYTPTSNALEYYEDSSYAGFTTTDQNIFTSSIVIPASTQAASIQIVNDTNGADYLADGKTVIKDTFVLYSPDYYYSYTSNLFYYDNMSITYTGTTLEISYDIINNGFDTDYYVSSSNELNLSGYLILPFITKDDPSSDDSTDVVADVPNTNFANKTELLMQFTTTHRTLMTQTVNSDGNYEITYSINLGTSTETFNFYAMNNTSTNYYSFINDSVTDDDDNGTAGTVDGIDFTNSWENMTFLQVMGSLENTSTDWWETSSLVNGDISNFTTFFDITKAKFVPQIELQVMSTTDTQITTYTYTMLSKEQYDAMVRYSNEESQRILTYGSWIAITVSITAFVMGLVAFEGYRQLKDKKKSTKQEPTK